MRYNSHKVFFTETLYRRSRKRTVWVPYPCALNPLPHCLTHLHDHISLVRSENGILYDSRSRFHSYVELECGHVYSQCTRSQLGSRSWRRRPVWLWFSCPHPAKQWTYVDGVLEPVILQLCIVRLWILVARMYRRLPLGNFQMRRNVRLQELEQVAKVRDYERCFSLDRRTTNPQVNLSSLYRNGMLTWRRSRLSTRLIVHCKA